MKKLLVCTNLLLALVTFGVVDNSYSKGSEVSTASTYHEVALGLDLNGSITLGDDELPFKH
ncbi:hypothetical protein [Priestia koreensis]|uniref:hypothetical protein n=1 Tax=Priestia koreensis TaxID=284581 RepID=UPI001F58671E|nr:hypothetical protein [Priestia koreensis]MCM3003320.1 hypothetical protein [Priestia koreensis]UNL86118.1 hypothetical protein IE339_06355 [Priestia koreensis]